MTLQTFEWQTIKRIQTLPEQGFEDIASLMAFWRERRDTFRVPPRAAFNPFSLRQWLGHVDIYEFLPKTQDFLIRLNGSNVVELTGEDWTGRMISEVDRRFHTTLHSDLMTCLQEEGPVMHTMPIFQRPHLRAVRLLLPLAREEQGSPEFVMMALYAN